MASRKARLSEARTRHSVAETKKKELKDARVNPANRDAGDTDSSCADSDDDAGSKRKNRLHTPVPRSSWQMECLEANRRGDIKRLRAVYARKEAKINLVTAERAYGGFRYVTWGKKSYGGDPDGQTMLHLAVRPDNGVYPNRRDVAILLIELGSDVNMRDGEDKSPRDVNTLLMDTVYPIKAWNVKDAHSFFLSAGKRVKIDHLQSWLRVFDSYRVDGPEVTRMWSAQAFSTWVDDRLADLTRVGITAIALEEETPRWIFELERLYEDTRKATKARRRIEMLAKREKEAEAQREALGRLKMVEERLAAKGLVLAPEDMAVIAGRDDGDSTDASEGEETLGTADPADQGPLNKDAADLDAVGASFLPPIDDSGSRPPSRGAFRGDPSAFTKRHGSEAGSRPGTADSEEADVFQPKLSPYGARH